MRNLFGEISIGHHGKCDISRALSDGLRFRGCIKSEAEIAAGGMVLSAFVIPFPSIRGKAASELWQHNIVKCFKKNGIGKLQRKQGFDNAYIVAPA